MISQMAIEDLDEMIADGLKPTPEDIIRLNALGLKCEVNDGIDHYILPRVAFLGKYIYFREPTIGHSMWIDRAMRICTNDLTTLTALRAFALSRPLSALPEAEDRESVRKAVDDFTNGALSVFTFTQIHAAVTYALHGNDGIALEYPVARPDAPVIEDDVAVSIGAGVMVETLAMGLGVSVRDVCSMTASQARRLQEIGLAKSGFSRNSLSHKDAVGDYTATKFAIIERLKGSENNG